MKNFLISLVVCIATYIGITYALKNYTNNQSVNSSVTDSVNEKLLDNQSTEKDLNSGEYSVNINPTEIQNDYKLWREYNSKNIELSYDFTPIDNENNIIGKEDFINKLKTGFYIPLKVDGNETSYKLYKLPEGSDEKIKKSIKSSSVLAHHYFKKEGEILPEFEFTDLTGNKYSKSSIEGRITVIKCWFINCVVCVQEFPELNELYDRYEGNENVAFISLAFDKEEKLKKFLAKKKFRYPVVGEQKNYMTKKLGIKQYPTHIIVGEDGSIIKMMNNVHALINTLDQLIDEEYYGEENETKTEKEGY